MPPTFASFEQGLSQMLQEAWSHRVGILGNANDGINTLYGFYNNATDEVYHRTQDFPVLKKFLAEIAEIHDETKKRVIVQGCKLEKSELTLSYYGADQDITEQLAESLPEIPPPHDLWTTFYHFLADTRSGPCNKRIYFHTRGLAESTLLIANLAWLLDSSDCPGFLAVKVGAPGNAGRLDSIVAYLTDDQAVEKVLARMKSLPRLSNLCADPLPHGVKALPGLAGIGAADEPADLQLVGEVELKKNAAGTKYVNPDKQSYGMFLAKLIYMALTDSDALNASGPGAFLEQFMAQLDVLKIDPMSPEKSTHGPMLEQLQQNSLFSKRNRRDRPGKKALDKIAADKNVADAVHS